MTFSSHQLKQMERAQDEWLERSDNLLVRLLGFSYSTEHSRQHGMEGVSRRIQLLRHILVRIGDILPPTAQEPDRCAVMDATAMTHAFTINVFGAIDNLAWVWVLEKGIRKPNGKPLRDRDIGFGAKCTTLRDSLPDDLRSYVERLGDWFEWQLEYRHGLAHRIPPYIVPKTLSDADMNEIRRINDDREAAFWAGDFARHGALLAELHGVGRFTPLTALSHADEGGSRYFHPQMICDFATLIELGENVLAAI